VQHLHLGWLDYSILLFYFLLVLGIGWALRTRIKASSDFLLASRSIPAWVTGLAFLSVNLGAQEVMGMAACGAKYGIMSSHFYWVGAIPAMIFLGVFMMPFYYGSKARSVPEYLKMRFDNKTHAFNAITFALMTIFVSGISLHALARLQETLIGWPYGVCIGISALIVLFYVFLGGLTSAIYNEVIQFCMLVLGLAPLVFFGLKDVGGWTALQQKLAVESANRGFAPGTFSESWQHLGSPAQNPMGVGWFGLVMGLGFVLSFGYWCTDFLVVQRAMAARTMSAARRTPLIAAIPKMLFPALIILPGMIALGLQHTGATHLLPLGQDGLPDYNLTIPMMLKHYFPTGLLGLGFTALVASFMSGMAGNVTAFNTVWTYDLYQGYLAPGKSDKHYLWMGRVVTVIGILASIGAAYVAAGFNNIMDLIQLVSGFVNAPLFATFLLGMFWRRTTGHGAFFGLFAGTLGAGLFHGLAMKAGADAGIKGGWLSQQFIFQSEMGQTFWMAIVAWTLCFLITVLISLLTRRAKTDQELVGLVYSLTPKPDAGLQQWYHQPVTIGIIVLAAVILLNIIFW